MNCVCTRFQQSNTLQWTDGSSEQLNLLVNQSIIFLVFNKIMYCSSCAICCDVQNQPNSSSQVGASCLGCGKVNPVLTVNIFWNFVKLYYATKCSLCYTTRSDLPSWILEAKKQRTLFDSDKYEGGANGPGPVQTLQSILCFYSKYSIFEKSDYVIATAMNVPELYLTENIFM